MSEPLISHLWLLLAAAAQVCCLYSPPPDVVRSGNITEENKLMEYGERQEAGRFGWGGAECGGGCVKMSVCAGGGDAVGRHGGQLDSIFWSRQIHTIRGTSHADDACEDGDNQPPPDTHTLL